MRISLSACYLLFSDVKAVGLSPVIVAQFACHACWKDPLLVLISCLSADILMLCISSLQHRNLLLTVGSEEPGYSSATLKLWEIPKQHAAGASTKAPPLSSVVSSSGPGAPLRSAKIFGPKHHVSEITAVAAREMSAGGLSVAVGLCSGMVYIMTCDLAGE